MPVMGGNIATGDEPGWMGPPPVLFEQQCRAVPLPAVTYGEASIEFVIE